MLISSMLSIAKHTYQQGLGRQLRRSNWSTLQSAASRGQGGVGGRQEGWVTNVRDRGSLRIACHRAGGHTNCYCCCGMQRRSWGSEALSDLLRVSQSRSGWVPNSGFSQSKTQLFGLIPHFWTAGILLYRVCSVLSRKGTALRSFGLSKWLGNTITI